ncbi:MAG TPA: GreA/GreB family elongation factor [Candidatus Binatia bacterium]|jgi:transcription elongation GreA/GreB family factor
MSSIDKRAVVAALRARIVFALESLTASHKAVHAGAVHPDAKQEHSKDMRATEASYLARGLAERVETLRDAVRALDLMPLRAFGNDETISTGALVTIADGEDFESSYLLAPAGGGERVSIAGREVLVLTPQSPLGSSLLGRCLGESVSVDLPAGRKAVEIVDVQ